MYNINTSNKHHFHRQHANLSFFQRKIFYVGIKIFNILPCSLTTLKNEEAKLRVASRKYLNTHSFYCADKLVNRWFIILLCKISIIFYTVKMVYTCILMNCSTSCFLCDTLFDQWNVCTRVYICTYLCME